MFIQAGVNTKRTTSHHCIRLGSRDSVCHFLTHARHILGLRALSPWLVPVQQTHPQTAALKTQDFLIKCILMNHRIQHSHLAVHTVCVHVPVVHVLIVGQELHKTPRLHPRVHPWTCGQMWTAEEDKRGKKRTTDSSCTLSICLCVASQNVTQYTV